MTGRSSARSGTDAFDRGKHLPGDPQPVEIRFRPI